LVGKDAQSFLLITGANSTEFVESRTLGLRVGREEAIEIARRHIITKFEVRYWPELNGTEPGAVGGAPAWVVYLSFTYKDNFRYSARVSIDGRDGHIVEIACAQISNLPRMVVIG
jgi:hypothetical protein